MQIRQLAQGFGQIRSLPWIHHWRRQLPSCWPSSFCELSELGLRVANGQALTTSHPRMRPAGLESARRSGGRYALRCHDWIGQCLLSGDGALWPDPLEPSGADVCHQPTYPDRRRKPASSRPCCGCWMGPALCFPFDKIKIDQAFVQGLGTTTKPKRSSDYFRSGIFNRATFRDVASATQRLLFE